MTAFVVARGGRNHSGLIGQWTVWQIPANGVKVVAEKLAGVVCRSRRDVAEKVAKRLNLLDVQDQGRAREVALTVAKGAVV